MGFAEVLGIGIFIINENHGMWHFFSVILLRAIINQEWKIAARFKRLKDTSEGRGCEFTNSKCENCNADIDQYISLSVG